MTIGRCSLNSNSSIAESPDESPISKPPVSKASRGSDSRAGGPQLDLAGRLDIANRHARGIGGRETARHTEAGDRFGLGKLLTAQLVDDHQGVIGRYATVTIGIVVIRRRRTDLADRNTAGTLTVSERLRKLMNRSASIAETLPSALTSLLKPTSGFWYGDRFKRQRDRHRIAESACAVADSIAERILIVHRPPDVLV